MYMVRVYGVLIGALLLSGCLGDEPDIISCDDIDGAETASFEQVAADLQLWCQGCHNADSPVYGYDFSTKAKAYESASHRADRIYAQVATGMMPPGGAGWNDTQLRAFRTWYCHGAFYE